MAINEQHRQLEIARELEETARTLAHSTRTIPNPSQSYDLIAELCSTITLLGQVSRQLARWTTNTTNGVHYQGHDPSTDTTNPVNESAKALKMAATALDATYTCFDRAQGENGRIRWYSREQVVPTSSNVQIKRSGANTTHQTTRQQIPQPRPKRVQASPGSSRTSGGLIW